MDKAGQDSLEALARQVIKTVMELSGSSIEPEHMAQAVRQAASRHLNSRESGTEKLLARLAAETPRLINLARLARLTKQGISLDPATATGPGHSAVVGQSQAFTQALANLEAVAHTGFPVLLCGETGTGKELLARRLHQLSSRSEGPFMPVNCAALAKSLLESELFGHVRGAFTGANSPNQGYIRAAAGGTLFLDEIGETSRDFQVRLLRVLEDQVVVPVGSHQGEPVDFRLVCASHMDLEAAAKEGNFSQALLYRINVVPVMLPPLRERKGDIALLVDHFLDQACGLAGKRRRISPEAMEYFESYAWPGNVRELSHLVQRLVALAKTELIGPEQLPASMRRPDAGESASGLGQLLNGVKGIPRKRHAGIARFLAEHTGQEVSNADLRAALGCSDSTAKNLFRALSQAGLVTARGIKGGRRYQVG
jgi:transcriptional regulator with GAF, ATPase, and Fis domain